MLPCAIYRIFYTANVEIVMQTLENEKLSHEHNYNFDLIRILGALLVIANHCLDSLRRVFQMGNNALKVDMSLYVICRLAVPLFLMLSGYLLLPRTYDKQACKKFYLNNLLSIWVCFAFWVIFYNIFKTILGNEFCGIKHLLKEIFFVEYVCSTPGLEWYFYILVVLYLFVPLLANGLKLIPTKVVIVICCIIFVYFFAFPNALKTYLDGTYFFYFFLGYLAYIYMHRENKSDKKRNVIINLCLFLVFYLVTIFFIIRKFNQSGTITWIWYDSPAIPAIAFSLFLFLIEFVKVRPSKILKKLSTLTFGVFLTHYIFVELFVKFVKINSVAGFFIAEVATATVASFLVVFLISFIPYARKLLFRIK